MFYAKITIFRNLPLTFLVSVVWATSTITIHLSPNGTDSRQCGSNINKCQSINHVLNLFSLINHNSNDLQLVLESHPSKDFVYKIIRRHRLKRLTTLFIRKDQHQNLNPTIHGDDINGVFIPGKQFHLQIKSVNLERFQLFDTKHTAAVNLTLDVNDSVIRRHPLPISSFINDRAMRRWVARNAYHRYMELIKDRRLPIDGMYLNPVDVKPSNRIQHFFQGFIPGYMRMTEVQQIHDLISNRNFSGALKKLPPMSKQKFNQLILLVFLDRDSTTFLKVSLDKGSKITFRNCSMIFGGRIELDVPKDIVDNDGRQSTFLLENSIVAGFFGVKLRRVSRAIIKNCIFRNIVTVKSPLIDASQCDLQLESSSFRSGCFQRIITVNNNSTLTIKSVDLTHLRFQPLGWNQGMFIEVQFSVAFIGRMLINDIFSNMGSLITSSSTTIEDSRFENSRVGQFFRLRSGHTSMTNVSFEKCSAQVFCHFTNSATLDNVHMRENNARLRFFLANHGASVLVRNSTFDRNSAVNFAYLGKSKLTFQNSVFTKNHFILYLVECKRESFLGSLRNQISGNACDGLYKAADSSNIASESDLISENKFNQNVLEIEQSRAIVLDTRITSNVFTVFMRSFVGSRASIDSVIYDTNNATGEGHFARTVNSAMNLINTVIVSENSGNSVLNLFTSRFSSSNTSIRIAGSTSRQVPVLRWNVDRTVLTKKKNRVQLTMSCPQNFNFVNRTNIERDFIDYEVSCQSCSKGTFSLKSGEMLVTSEIISNFTVFTVDNTIHQQIIDKLFGYNVAISPIVCRACPPGGVCETTVRSRKNFYGFVDGKGYLEFIQCPAGYCCSSTEECKTIKSCRQHRSGRLCGRCEAGYQISYATNKCVKSHRCTDQILFWIGFGVMSVSLAFILSFASMIKDGLKNVFKVNIVFYFFMIFFVFYDLMTFSKLNEISYF